MELGTRFTDLVGCSVPLQLAPMGPLCTPELIGAVTGAGAMGMTATILSEASELASALERLAADGIRPLGVNVLIPFLDLDAVDAAAERVRAVDFYHGNPDPALVDRVHRGGALAAWQVCSVAEARSAADAGCDYLVVHGLEAGGRMWPSPPLWPLLDRVLDNVDLPVLAAGGLATGRHLAAALAAGADGVRMGTRFVASVECGAHPRWKQAIIDAHAGDTVVTDAFSVMWPGERSFARTLRCSEEAAMSASEDIVGKVTLGNRQLDIPRFAFVAPLPTTTGRIEAMPMYAGESVAAIESVEPAAQLVRQIADEAAALLRRWGHDGI